ncbi:tetratricopeptide repeat protein [Actinoplanes sp. NBC_00393]|uniref:AfsR/SARP family transcriptional regulator n=1 Tax=Actinoplanes sp. NBC_00393 TaxID=2975953 RepID=UPI002E1AD1D0
MTADGRPVVINADRDRVVLAMLLLNPGRIVGSSELTEAVWGADPPTTARGQLQTCISRLRRALPAGVIITDPAGYGIRVGPNELDALVFARLIGEANFRAALDLWRGPALAEIDSAAVRRQVAVLDERHAVAVEDWADQGLAAGRERELLGELTALVDQHPLRERLRGQLMLALHRSGRQADALAEFRRITAVLGDELGIEPGKELQDLHRELLAGEAPEAVPAVRCLPRTVGDFTGHGDLVGRLIRTIEADDGSGPVEVVIDGMAGSGKTTLALHVAGLVGERYPDAHLFVDLHGHSEQQPLPPAAALLVLLRQLGLGAETIPAGLVDRVSLWRTEVARRRVLVVFDNAGSSEQVADLLPTAPGSLALVTSRRRLAGLDGVYPEALPLLDPDEAVTLLARIAGERVRAEPEAAAEVVRRCGGLPLAIRLAGSRLAHRPRWRVSDLLSRLGAATLPQLSAEDRTVSSAFALTYRQLGEPARRLFRLLGVYPGAGFDAHAVAALTGLPYQAADDLLNDLVDVHLLENPARNLFRLHDLLREYAVLLAADLPGEVRREAIVNVLDHHLHAAVAAATDTQRPMLQRDLGAAEPLRPDLLATLTDPVDRLERERPNLTLFIDAAAGADARRYCWTIPRAAWPTLYFRGYHDDFLGLFHQALAAIENDGDKHAIATIANYLAGSYSRIAEHDTARSYLERSIQLRTELGDMASVAVSYGNLASLHDAMGRFADAIEALRTTRRLLILTGRDPVGAHTPLMLFGVILGRLGRYEEAVRETRLQLLAAVARRDDEWIALCLDYLQRLRFAAGTLSAPDARRYVRAALRLLERAASRYGVGDGHNELGRLFRAEGRYPEAIAEHRIALDIVSRTGDRRQQADFRYDYGTTLAASGDLSGAREAYQESLRIAQSARQPYLIARAQAGLADLLADADPAQARRLWEWALAAFEQMDVPERFDVAQRLKNCDPATAEGRWSGDD